MVARLANAVLREAVAADNGPGAILDVADLAAPSVVEALLELTTHTIKVAGIDFVVSGATATEEGTLRQMYGDLAPVAVIRSECLGRSRRGDCLPRPRRRRPSRGLDGDDRHGRGADRTRHQDRQADSGGARAERPLVARLADTVRAFRDDINPMFYRALAVGALLLLGSTITLRLAYRHPGMSWMDALYFSTETIATVGYGDFNFLNQPLWLRLWGVCMMLAGVGTTAIVVAFVADVLLSRRITLAANRQQIRHLRRHVVVVGLGSFGIRVASMIKAAGHDVAVIERNEDNRYLSGANELDVPVIFGDATLRQTLEAARLEQARAVAVLTQDDMVNIETGVVIREMIGNPRVIPELHRPHVPIVLRIYDQQLGHAVGHRFGFEFVRSTVDLATPWFIGAAMGLDVLGTFSVGQRSFMVGGVKVRPGSELDGMRMFELSTHTRVIAIEREGSPVRLHPRRETQLAAGDTAYLVGPYRELIETLRKGQRASQPGKVRRRATRTG